MGEEITNPHIASVVKESGLHFCTSCKTYRPIGDFYLKKNGQPRTPCKECVSLYNKLRSEAIKSGTFVSSRTPKRVNPDVESVEPINPPIRKEYVPLDDCSTDTLINELRRRGERKKNGLDIDVTGIFTPASLMGALANAGYTGELQYEYREIRTVMVKR